MYSQNMCIRHPFRGYFYRMANLYLVKSSVGLLVTFFQTLLTSVLLHMASILQVSMPVWTGGLPEHVWLLFLHSEGSFNGSLVIS